MSRKAINPEITEFSEEAEISKGKILEPVVYKFIIMAGQALGDEQYMKFCNLIKFLVKTFPYDNKSYEKELKKAKATYEVAIMTNQRTMGQRVPMEQIEINHAMEIYGILSRLLKAKNMFPRPAEHGEF